MSKLASVKARARRALHAAMSLDAEYQHANNAAPADVKIRWHTKQALMGELDNGGYAERIESVNRLIFNLEELTEKQIELHRGGKVTIVDADYVSETGERPRFILELEEEDTGPIERTWQVVRA